MTISSGYVSGDQLAATAQFGITVTPGVNGSIALAGSATRAQYETVLQSVAFSSTSDDPTSADRTVAFSVLDDAAATSNIATRTVTVTPVNDAPTLSHPAGGVTYTEDGPPVPVMPSLTLSDPDTTTLASASVAIGTNFAALDVLGFSAQPGSPGTTNASTGVLTFTGTASLATYQAALRSVTYVTSAQDPSTAPRDVTVVANDGTVDSAVLHRAVTVSAVNDAPTLGGGAAERSRTPTAIGGGRDPAVADRQRRRLREPHGCHRRHQRGPQGWRRPELHRRRWHHRELQLGDRPALPVWLGLARRLPAGAAVGHLHEHGAHRSVDREDALDHRHDGSLTSAPVNRTLNYTALNSAPTVTASGGSTPTSEGLTGAAIDPALTVVDTDDVNLAGATVTISSGLTAGDQLLFTNQNGIVGGYNGGTGVLTLTGPATVALYEAALRSVKFVNAGPVVSSGTRTITFAATDPQSATGSDTKGITFTAVDDAPVIATSSGTTSYTENDPATVVDAGLTVSDPDSANLTEAHVTLMNPSAGDMIRVSGSIRAV